MTVIRRATAATLLLATSLCRAGAASAADVPDGTAGGMLPFEARYTLIYKGFTAAVTTLTLSRTDAGLWTYRSGGEARGLFRALPIDNPAQSSELRFVAGSVQPLHFRQSNGDDDGHAIDLSFDWNAGRVRGTVARHAVDENVPADTQDDLSIQIALISAMARGEAGGTFHTYGDRGLREYRWHADGEEMLHTAIGEVATRLFVTERTGSPRVTRYWCAPAYGYLPVKVEQHRLDALEWTLEVRSLKRGLS